MDDKAIKAMVRKVKDPKNPPIDKKDRAYCAATEHLPEPYGCLRCRRSKPRVVCIRGPAGASKACFHCQQQNKSGKCTLVSDPKKEQKKGWEKKWKPCPPGQEITQPPSKRGRRFWERCGSVRFWFGPDEDALVDPAAAKKRREGGSKKKKKGKKRAMDEDDMDVDESSMESDFSSDDSSTDSEDEEDELSDKSGSEGDNVRDLNSDVEEGEEPTETEGGIFSSRLAVARTPSSPADLHAALPLEDAFVVSESTKRYREASGVLNSVFKSVDELPTIPGADGEPYVNVNSVQELLGEGIGRALALLKP